MQELNRHVEDHTQILFGTSVDNKMGDRLSVTLISSIAGKESAVAPAPPFRSEPAASQVSVSKPIAPPAVVRPEKEPEPVSLTNEEVEEPESPKISEEKTEVDEPLPAPRVVAAPRPPRRERKTAPSKESPVEPPVAAVKSSAPAKEKSVQARQEVMQFEPVTRGRFEKSEPTIVEGQDLDVPTYLRKNVRVK
jgi:cell division protein FtsZ